MMMQIGAKIARCAASTVTQATDMAGFLRPLLSATAMHATDMAGFLRRLLSARNRGLFLQLLTLSAVLSAAPHLFKLAALSISTDAADSYISPHNMDIPRVLTTLVTELPTSDRPWFLLAYLTAGVAVGSAVYIATVFFAVLAHSGSNEHHRITLSSFVREVKSNPWKPAGAFALGGAMRLVAVSWPAALPCGACQSVAVGFVVEVLDDIFWEVQAVAVAASVAEARGAAGAVVRACLLRERRIGQALAYYAGSGALGTTFLLLAGALVSLPGLPAVVGAAVACVLVTAGQMLSVANMTGYYFACRKDEEQKERKKGDHQD